MNNFTIKNMPKLLIFILFFLLHLSTYTSENNNISLTTQQKIDFLAKIIKGFYANKNMNDSINHSDLKIINNLLKDESYQELLNVPDMNGLTPLMNACMFRPFLIVATLLTYPNIDVNAEVANPNNQAWLKPLVGMTALSFAVRHWHKNPKDSNSIIELLLKKGALNTRMNYEKQERMSVIWDLPLQTDNTQVPINMSKETETLFQELQKMLLESKQHETK